MSAPGISPELRRWAQAASERVAAEAPTLTRGDEITTALVRCYARFPGWLEAHRAASPEASAA